MQREKKLWGERWLLRIDSTHATSYLILKANTRCSWHVHAAKFNLFVVLTGKVGIKTEDGETILGPGQEFMVAPGIFHEFRVYEDSTMIEEMYVAYKEEDITRKDIGGSLDE